jgi:hypothetical protein
MAIFGINQNRWALTSGHFSAYGIRIYGLQSLAPSEEVKVETSYGSGSIGVGRVQGQHSASATLEVLLAEYDQLIKALGGNFVGKPFDVVGTFLEVSGDGIFTVGIPQGVISKTEMKASNDGKAIVQALTLHVVEPIDWNGVKLIEQDLSSFDATGFGLTITT